LVFRGKDLYLDGNKVEVQKEDLSAQNIIVPMADRDIKQYN
jgi:hypothetical protein